MGFYTEKKPKQHRMCVFYGRGFRPLGVGTSHLPLPWFHFPPPPHLAEAFVHLMWPLCEDQLGGTGVGHGNVTLLGGKVTPN